MTDFIGSSYEALYPAALPDGVAPYEESASDLSIVAEFFPNGNGWGSRGNPSRPASQVFKGTSSQRDFFYDVVHLYTRDFTGAEIPAEFYMGAITADTQLKTFLWNAYLDNYVDIGPVTETDGVGIENQFIGNPALPFTLQPFEEVEWDFLVRKEVGPPNFNSTQTVRSYPQIVGLVRYLNVIISGSRSDLLAFVHNWANPCTETLEWLTALNVAHDGTEHRAALREVARRYMDVTWYLTRDSARKLDHLLYARQAAYLSTPIHPFATKLTSNYTAGSLVIYCDTVGKGFTVGTPIMLIDPLESSGDSMSIASVFPDHLGLVGGGVNSWPKGAVIYPAGATRIIGDVPLVWETNNFATATARLELQPTWVPANTPHAPYSEDYQTYTPALSGVFEAEVMTHEPDWAGGLQRNFSYESGVTDSQTGVLNVYETRKRPARTITHNFLLRSPHEIQSFREFLHRRRGRAVPFWAPTWVSDLRSVVDTTYLFSGTELLIYDNGFIAYSLQADYADKSKQERSNLQIELKNGTIIRRRVSSASAIDMEVTSIILAEPMGYEFTASSIKRISWLGLYRLVDDSVTFEWLTPGVARVSLPMVTVPDYLVDPGYIPEGGPVT